IGQVHDPGDAILQGQAHGDEGISAPQDEAGQNGAGQHASLRWVGQAQWNAFSWWRGLGGVSDEQRALEATPPLIPPWGEGDRSCSTRWLEPSPALARLDRGYRRVRYAPDRQTCRPAKIGRASCRERVEIGGVAVRIKKE